MAVSYNKLWKLLVDKKMSKADLRKASGVSPNTMTKLRRDEPVMLSVLDKICKTLDVNYGDIVDYIADEEGREVPGAAVLDEPTVERALQEEPPVTVVGDLRWHLHPPFHRVWDGNAAVETGDEVGIDERPCRRQPAQIVGEIESGQRAFGVRWEKLGHFLVVHQVLHLKHSGETAMLPVRALTFAADQPAK